MQVLQVKMTAVKKAVANRNCACLPWFGSSFATLFDNKNNSGWHLLPKQIDFCYVEDTDSFEYLCLGDSFDLWIWITVSFSEKQA